MSPLNNKGINEMNELDCLRALVARYANGASLNGKGINELNELDCLRLLVVYGATF
jgi:hypothetical protein